MEKRAKILAMFFVVLAMVSTATGQIITVDDDGQADFNNIQAAIDHAYDGVTIVVADGIYRGVGNRNITFRGKAIILRSENGWRNCIIDCEGEGYGFYFYSNEGEDSVIDGLTFINGNAKYGGIYINHSNPTIKNCRISGNLATWGSGAGIYCKKRSCPSINNCIISGNIGNGITCYSESHPVINNCLIVGNTRGGIFCYDYSSPMISNCTITENNAGWGGGICVQHYSSPTINNCIVWGNRANFGDEIALIDQTYPSELTVRYSDVQGGSAAVYISPGCRLNWGQGNIDADPMFMDIDGLDDVLGTEDDNLRLFGCSPCIDAGDNSGVPPSLLTDIEGNPRIINDTVDIGAYEGVNQGFLLSTKSLTVPEGATATFTVMLAMDPLETIEVTVAVESGDPDIIIESGALLTFDSSNYFLGQTVVLAAAEDGDNLNGTAAVWISALGIFTNGISATEEDNDEPTSNILFVDASSPGVNNGSNWREAYAELQDAIIIATRFPQVEEIRVGQGTYTPAEHSGDRTATFKLTNGVVIKGGYAGFSGPDPNARHIELYETILSGDLAGNDVDVNDPADLLDEPTRAENSYHVVTTSDTNETTVLDGFTIIGGNANRKGSFNYQDCGGGVYNYKGSPTIKDCKIGFNSAREHGGGMYNDGRECECSPTIINCKFIANSASSGSGIYNYRINTIIDNCKFAFNWASEYGGGIFNGGQSIGRLTNCTFIGNRATLGGGMINGDSSTVLTNCTFNENLSTYGGGAVFNGSCSPTFMNCRFKGNSAVSKGGGMVNASSSPILRNCTFSNNSAENGGGMCNYMDRGPGGFDPSNPTLTNCIFSINLASENGGGMCNSDNSHPTLNNCTFAVNSALNGNALACDSYQQKSPSNIHFTNSILRDGGNEIWNGDGSTITITYSDVQGGWPGEGNIDADPCFGDPGYWDANDTPDDPNDDFWVDGDYHLKSQSGRWDPISQTWVQDDVTSLCIDAGDPMSPIGPEPFPNGGIINMGAYGGTTEASKSYFGKPPCETIVAGDINGDCEVNFLDFRLMALHWCEDNNP